MYPSPPAVPEPRPRGIEPALSLHRACIEPASSHSIEPASSFQHRASKPGLRSLPYLRCGICQCAQILTNLRDNSIALPLVSTVVQNVATRNETNERERPHGTRRIGVARRLDAWLDAGSMPLMPRGSGPCTLWGAPRTSRTAFSSDCRQKTPQGTSE